MILNAERLYQFEMCTSPLKASLNYHQARESYLVVGIGSVFGGAGWLAGVVSRWVKNNVYCFGSGVNAGFISGFYKEGHRYTADERTAEQKSLDTATEKYRPKKVNYFGRQWKGVINSGNCVAYICAEISACWQWCFGVISKRKEYDDANTYAQQELDNPIDAREQWHRAQGNFIGYRSKLPILRNSWSLRLGVGIG